MKIAFVYDAIYPWMKGGGEKRVYELAHRLVLRGHDVHWYGIGWWWPEKGQKDIELDGIHLHGVCKPVKLYVDGKNPPKRQYFLLLNFYQFYFVKNLIWSIVKVFHIFHVLLLIYTLY